MASFMIVHPKLSHGRLSSKLNLMFVGLGHKTNEASSYYHSLKAVHSAAGTQQVPIPNKTRLSRAESQNKGRVANDMVVLIKLASIYIYILKCIKPNKVYQNFVICLRPHAMTSDTSELVGSSSVHRPPGQVLSVRDPFQILTKSRQKYNGRATSWMQEIDQHPAIHFQPSGTFTSG